jgi:hypothetical protein
MRQDKKDAHRDRRDARRDRSQTRMPSARPAPRAGRR